MIVFVSQYLDYNCLTLKDLSLRRTLLRRPARCGLDPAAAERSSKWMAVDIQSES